MKFYSLLISFLCCSLAVLSQSITYEFSAPNAVHHEAEITVIASKVPAGPVYFRMSRSSPGRYAKHEFGKNVYNVKAVDEKGNALAVQKADADIYMISKHGATVKVSYTIYGNHADGTYMSIDQTGYHLNMPATFMWVKGMEKYPMTLHFNLTDKDWKIATQLKPGADDYTFSAPNLQYFMDSPTKVGDLKFREWKITNPDKKQYTFRIALEAETTPEVFDAFAQKVERMVKEAQAVYGEVPAYDYGTYTFIASINPYVKGDGMEHRNSTMITIPRNFDGSLRLLGVFSHEFFHCWNVERIRPADLEPFNFEKSNMSEGLWVAEGFTQYYGDLILKRAGLIDEDEFLGEMAGLINTKVNTPGAQNYSPIENSQRAVFVDAGVAIDKTNYPNMYSSYYTYGGATALALDLDLRTHFSNVSLDNFMRELWKRFGKTGVPYKVADLQPALAAITNQAYAADFFKKFVYGHQQFDYAVPLQKANFMLQQQTPNKAWVGRTMFTPVSNGLQIANNTVVNTPLYEAGADIDDIITSADGKKVSDRGQFNSIVDGHKPGDVIPISYIHRGKTIDASMTLTENPMLKLEEQKDAITGEQEAFKKAWLGDKAMLN